MVRVNEINGSDYNEVIEKGVVLVDIGSESWCGPCKILGPILEQIAVDFNNEGTSVSLNKMDVDTNRDKAVELGVTSIPTIFIYKDGVQVERHTGVVQKNRLKEMLIKYTTNE